MIQGNHLLYHNFLPLNLLKELQEVVLLNQHKFCPSRVNHTHEDINEDWRKSLVLNAQNFPEIYIKIKQIIIAQLPSVQDALATPEFKFTPQALGMSLVESQITASGDGAFYKTHLDIGTGCRYISYVIYFFMGEEKKFSGGELQLHQCEGEDVLLAPEHNSIVWFLSRTEHEILPVSVPSKQFLDSRFTYNGWINVPFPPAMIGSNFR